MEKYKVINSFKDLEDNGHIYIKDKDIYPREGLEPTKKRIKELASTKNKIGKILIEKTEENTEETEENAEEVEKNEEENTEEIKENKEEVVTKETTE